MSGYVYSYLRFSDRRQATGHSIQRQTEFAEKWAKEHGLTLDQTLTMRDEGLSAYHQKHVKNGALGVFLSAVQAGKVPPGSVLIVESLDRLSRADAWEAQAQLAGIVKAGLIVVTASDDEVYSRETLTSDPYKLVMSVLYMIRAHEESASKAKRVISAIKNVCNSWKSGNYRGKIRQGQDPQWLAETETGWIAIPERVVALKRAVAMYLAGHSGQSISRRLAIEGVTPLKLPLGATHFYKLIKNPNLIGTKTVSADGETFALENYYPAVLSAEEWDDLQAVGTKRGRRGARSIIPHIITGIGITYCGYCGKAMSGQNLFGKIKKRGDKLKDGYRRLLCASRQYGDSPCPYPTSRSVGPIERAIMNYCSDIINLRALYGGDRTSPLREQLSAQRQRQSEVTASMDKLMEVILSASDGTTPAMLVKKAAELEAEKASLAKSIAHTEAQISGMARGDVDGVQSKWAELTKGVHELDYDARLQARQLVADTFARIAVYATGVRPRQDSRFTDVVLLAKGGVSRVLRIDKRGTWKALEDVQPETA